VFGSETSGSEPWDQRTETGCIEIKRIAEIAYWDLEMGRQYNIWLLLPVS
jgi:hypothetical protein